MTLKRLTPRHMDIIRRLIVGETPGEICLELGMSQSRLSVLQGEELFSAKMAEMQALTNDRFIDSRATAMQILENAAIHAARITVNASTGIVERLTVDDDGNDKIEYQEVPIALQMKSAWDILDRTGNKAPEKRIEVHATLADMINEAYKQKHKGDNEDQKELPIDVTPQPLDESEKDDIDISTLPIVMSATANA